MDKIIQALRENGYPIKCRNKENTHITVDVLSRKDLDIISEIVLRNSWSDDSKESALDQSVARLKNEGALVS